MSFSGKPSSSEGQRKNTVFTFKKRTSKVDWRKLASVDVSKIARELDFQCLQENIMNITFCDIEAEMDSQFVDSNFVKLFQLAQLIIEYLMHSQQFLQSKIGENERVLIERTQDLEKKEKELEDKENVVNHLKKENRKARKMLADYQLMMRTGASGIHKCPFCPKVFVSHEYLVSHQQRRHSRLLNTDVELPAKNSQVNNEVVQELQHIKERLASTERQLQEEKDAKQIEKEDKEMNKIKELEQRYAQWKEDEKQRQMNEMRDFKNSVMIELNEEKSALEQKIFELQKKSERVSLVRGIQDEDENHDASSRQQQQQQNDIQNIRKELHEEVTSIHTHAEENIRKLMDKYKKRELKMKKDNEAEKDKYESILKKFNDALEAERAEKEKMVINFEQKVNELNQKIIERERVKHFPRGKPPQPPSPAHEIGALTRERVEQSSQMAESDENDLMTLYVAFNGNDYQLRREASASSRDWSDQFSFQASREPYPPFNYPIYVYSAGGSPYWRQYISTKSSPPSNGYRTDYLFYVSSIPLAGSIACYLLEKGSANVIKSSIAKTETLSGWRNTGIKFYALKATPAGSPTRPLSRSGTLASDTGTEGVDDPSDSDELSVSSLNTATESAKKNLAEAIEMNRTKVEEVQKPTPRPLPPPPSSKAEQPEESLESESEDDQSEEELGTTLETGTFTPFERFPTIITQYNHKARTLEQCKDEVKEEFEQGLSKRGIEPETTRLSSKQLESRMKSLRSEQEGHAKKFRNFKEIRKRKAEEVDNLARKTSNIKKLAKSEDQPEGIGAFIRRSPTLKPSLKSTASAINAVRGFASPKASLDINSAELALKRRSSYTEPPSPKADMSFTTTSVTEPSESVSEESRQHEVDNRQHELTDEGSDEDVDWDSALSEEDAHGRKMVPKVSVHIPSQTSQVQELASSLERSLKRSSEIKKPAGAVALIHSTPNSAVLPSSNVNNFEDESDFLSSSPEPDSNKKQTGLAKKPLQSNGGRLGGNVAFENLPKKGVKFSGNNYSDFDDSDLDIENIS